MREKATIRFAAVTVCLVALASGAAEAGIDEWTPSDPVDGPGEVRTVVIDPQTPTTLYATTSAGLFRSTDSGGHWSAANDGSPVHALAIDPLNPATLYAAQVGGVFKSTDGGASWSEVNEGLTSTSIRTLVIDPQTPSTLYALTSSIGVFKSTDGAETWSEARAGLPSDPYFDLWPILSLAIDPQAPDTLYAGVNSCLHGLGCIPGAGVYKTTDGGVSWSPTGDMAKPYVRALAIDPLSPSTLYASVPGDVLEPMQNWVFKSTDGGATWSGSNDGFGPGIRAAPALAVDTRTTPATVYLGTSAGVYESTDGGVHWRDVGLSRVYSLAIDPEVPSRLYASSRRSVFGRLFLRQRRILSLRDGRFTVELEWRDYQGETGQGRVAAVFPETAEGAALRTRDTAVLRYSNPNNWEVLVKVLDGRALNDHFWVFLAAATNLELTTTITDTFCGRVRTYVNPLGLAAPAVTDTAAFSFSDCPSPGPPSCVSSESTLCLGENDRFHVDVAWRDFAGNAGSAKQASMPRAGPTASDDSGVFIYGDEDNWELLVKVLDGCGINDRFWVFAAGATTVETTLRITDTETGAVNEYVNPLGNAADAVTDTQAFASCW